ncbi:uncharacterized protein CG3556 [Oratosquilla oratoria]|uniref:uncharacterized protein CG3556 n=1 Tax=Oratosquilla oratoria TaxID=337810 RepID=UPI003F768D00
MADAAYRSKQLIAQIIALRESGKKTKEISEQLSCAKSTVRKWCARARDLPDDILPAHKPRSGRPRKTSTRADTIIKRILEASARKTARVVKEQNPGVFVLLSKHLHQKLVDVGNTWKLQALDIKGFKFYLLVTVSSAVIMKNIYSASAKAVVNTSEAVAAMLLKLPALERLLKGKLALRLLLFGLLVLNFPLPTAAAGGDGETGWSSGVSPEVSAGAPLPAVARAVAWVEAQRHKDWGWGADTPHTIVALQLVNNSWFKENNLEAQLVAKQLELELVLRLWKHRELPMTIGHLAISVMALVTLCKDPRAFYGKDLIAMMEHQDAAVDFEVSFAQLAVCTAGRHVRKSHVRRLLDITTDQSKIHSVDTLSVVILALHCAQRQRRHDLRHFINEAVSTLLEQQDADGSFNSNLHSTSLALQAMITSDLSGSWNYTRGEQYVMSHQLEDGSFGDLFDTNAVLPVLGGRSYLDVMDRECPVDNSPPTGTIDDIIDNPADLIEEDTSMPPPVPTSPPHALENITSPTVEMVKVVYILWIGTNASMSYNKTIMVPANTTFLTVMKIAAEEDEHYEFSASRWANGYYIHTINGLKEQKVGYWFWLLFRLREPPVPGVKPDNKYIIGTGVQETIVNDGDYFLFWYHKI